MKKILFLSVNYGIEGIEHGIGALNGFTAFSEMLIEGLANFSSVDVVTDRPDRFPGQRTFNIFHDTVERSTKFESFWRHEFCVSGATSEREFSRDTIYRLFQLASALNPQALDDLLFSDKYDVVILNRHEYFFLMKHAGLVNKEVILCAHDSNYLRKRSYERLFGSEQALTHVEKALEEALVADATKLIVISHDERLYFERLSEGCDVILFRPSVLKPKNLVSLNKKDAINFYFVGVNNFVNRQTLITACEIFSNMRGSRQDQFHIFGSVCDALEASPCDGVVVHGYVENLEAAISGMHVLLSPIHAGSGVPIKISDALGAGHLVVSSEFGSESYTEFVGSRIFICDSLSEKVIDELCDAINTFLPYTQYAAKNRIAIKQILGMK